MPFGRLNKRLIPNIRKILLILTAACAFGLEAIVKRELVALGYEPRVVQPGRISFEGDWPDICRANVFLRTADRVLIEIQQFDAPDFEALFETIKRFDWSQFIPAEAQFPVVGKSRLSKLTSLPAVQRSVKRALVESLKQHHGCEFLPETGAMYKVEIALLSDIATLTVDTTGPSLHKRGYRQLVGEAPIKETLAAALVDLSVWNQDRPLVDPFCGSGTIPIEAALLARQDRTGHAPTIRLQRLAPNGARVLETNRDRSNRPTDSRCRAADIRF